MYRDEYFLANHFSRSFGGFGDLFTHHCFKLRELIIDAIPADLKAAISAGIGLFIAFIGLQGGGLIVANKSTLVGLGSFSGSTWVTIFGLIVVSILMVMRVPGAIFIGMVLSAVFGIATGNIQMPHALVAPAPSMDQTS